MKPRTTQGGVFNEELQKALAPVLRKEVEADAENGCFVLTATEKGDRREDDMEEGQFLNVCNEFEDRLQKEKERIEAYCCEIDSMYGHASTIFNSIRGKMRDAAKTIEQEVQTKINEITESIPARMEHAANEIIRTAQTDLRREMRRVERRGRKACKDHNRIVDILTEKNVINSAGLRPRRRRGSR